MRENHLRVRTLLAGALAVSFCCFAARPVPKAVTENYDWRDGATLALEGRGFPNSSTPYDRLPDYCMACLALFRYETRNRLFCWTASFRYTIRHQ